MKKKKTNQKSAILYARTDDLMATGIEAKIALAKRQTKQLEKYCKQHGFNDLYSYCQIDPLDYKRHGFEAMIKDIKRGIVKSNLLLFTSWTVIAPLLDEHPKAMQLFEKHTIKLQSIKK